MPELQEREKSTQGFKIEELVLYVNENHQDFFTPVTVIPDDSSSTVDVRIDMTQWRKGAMAAFEAGRKSPIILRITHILHSKREYAIGGALTPKVLDIGVLIGGLNPPESLKHDSSILAADFHHAVSIKCAMHSYFHMGTQPKSLSSQNISHPIYVQCSALPSNDVTGDVHVKVVAGAHVRIISPTMGGALHLKKSSLGSKRVVHDAAKRGLWKEESAWEGNGLTAVVQVPPGGCTSGQCTLFFDLGERDKRNGGNIVLHPTNGQIVLVPEVQAKESLSTERGPQINSILVRSWALMEANVAHFEVYTAVASKTVAAAEAGIVAVCTRQDGTKIKAEAHLVSDEKANDGIATVRMVLEPAVSCTCSLSDSSGHGFGDVRVVSVSNKTCRPGEYLSRETGDCAVCPNGFKCLESRITKCYAKLETGDRIHSDLPFDNPDTAETEMKKVQCAICEADHE